MYCMNAQNLYYFHILIGSFFVYLQMKNYGVMYLRRYCNIKIKIFLFLIFLFFLIFCKYFISVYQNLIFQSLYLQLVGNFLILKVFLLHILLIQNFRKEKNLVVYQNYLLMLQNLLVD